MENKKQLPALSDLHHDPAIAFKNDQLNLLLNQPPPAAWVKKHPFAKNVDYLPIDKVEFLLTKIFQEWKCEVISYSNLFNSVSCHVRLHFKNPLTGEWNFQDGVGAVDVQTEKGASAADLSKINANAVMKALPAAKSYALKDAAELLGSLFGSNLNRKDTVAFSGSYSEPDEQLEQLKELFELKKDSLDNADVERINQIIQNKEVNSYKKVINKLQSL